MSFGAEEPDDPSAKDEKRKKKLEQDKLERLRNAQFLKNTTVSTPQSRLQSAQTTKPTLGGTPV